MKKFYSIDEYGVKNYSPIFPLTLTILFLLGVIFVGSIVLYVCEHSLHDGKIIDYWDSLWLAFMAASTIGFGAIYPTTEFGRLAVASVSCLGIISFGAIGTFSAMWAFSFFETETQNRELKSQNAEIIRTNNVAVETNMEIIELSKEIIRTNIISNKLDSSTENKLDMLLSKKD